eukprot:3503228-Rhodomonas_salina.1
MWQLGVPQAQVFVCTRVSYPRHARNFSERNSGLDRAVSTRRQEPGKCSVRDAGALLQYHHTPSQYRTAATGRVGR